MVQAPERVSAFEATVGHLLAVRPLKRLCEPWARTAEQIATMTGATAPWCSCPPSPVCAGAVQPVCETAVRGPERFGGRPAKPGELSRTVQLWSYPGRCSRLVAACRTLSSRWQYLPLVPATRPVVRDAGWSPVLSVCQTLPWPQEDGQKRTGPHPSQGWAMRFSSPAPAA